MFLFRLYEVFFVAFGRDGLKATGADRIVGPIGIEAVGHGGGKENGHGGPHFYRICSRQAPSFYFSIVVRVNWAISWGWP